MGNKQSVAMPSDLRSKNLSTILNTICRKQQFVVADLVSATNISRQTITKALSELMDLSIIVPVGKGNSSNVGGKKPIRYALNDHAYVICMSAGEHVTSFSLMTLSYRRVDIIEIKFLAEYSPDSFVQDSVAACHALLERNRLMPQDLLGISYCMGGIVDEQEGIIPYAATVPDWGRNIEIRRMITEVLGFDTRLTIDNVCRICARTMISHDNINQKNVAVFYCDYGMGISFIQEGALRKTPHKLAHEWGHVVLNPWDTERCGCGAYGCAEVLISERRIWQKIDALSPDRRELLMKGYDGEKDIRIHIMKKSRLKNPDACAIMDYLADLFGIIIRNVYLAIDPDYMVLLGALSESTEEFIGKAKMKAKENLYLADVEIDIRPYQKSIRELQEIGGVNTILRDIVRENLADSE